MELAIEELHGSLKATKTYFDTPSASWMTAPDYASRIKAVEIALNFAVGSPVKRQQILSGKMPDAPLDREQLRDAIDRRIAAKLGQSDLSANELLQLKKALAEAEQAEPRPKLTEKERELEIRQILGIEDYNDRGAVEPAPPAPS